eukprot:Skav203288  [mRNA]  locus=scaffold324:419478:422414:+ [translate_table: standard]
MVGFIKLHLEGPFSGLPRYEESLMSLQHGSRSTLVARIQFRDDNHRHGHVCTGLITGQAFRLKCPVPEGTTTVSIINAKVGFYRLPILEIDDEAAVLCHQQKKLEDLFTMTETCAGIGGIASGAHFAGWATKVQNELQAEFCRYQSKRSSIPVIQGDICSLQTVISMHHAAPTTGTLSMGFSCQPFSMLGDQREGEDSRSSTLPFGLFASWLLQKDLVVLECVPNAANSRFVQKSLLYHMQQTKMERGEALLELADTWPAKRRRWWTVLSKGEFGRICIPPMPRVNPMPNIHHLIPAFLELSPAELDQLMLTPAEVKAFNAYGKGMVSQIVDPNSPMNTGLHSWGNQVVDCACGCRPALSHHRLQQSGLFGALVVVRTGGVRHISPREMALLQGMPMPNETDFADNQRLIMAGLGQIASPLQAAWVFAHIRAHLCESRLTMLPVVDPKVILGNLCAELFKVRDTYYKAFPTVPMQLFQEGLMQQLMGHDHDASDMDVLQAVNNVEQFPTGLPGPVDAQAMPGVALPTAPGPSLAPQEGEEVSPHEPQEDDGAVRTDVPSLVPASEDAHATPAGTVPAATGPAPVEPSLFEPTTGALHAFGTNASPSPTVPQDAAVPSSEDVAMPASSPHHLRAILQPTVSSANEVVILDSSTAKFHVVRYGDEASVRQLIEAEMQASGQECSFRTLMGDVVDADTLLCKVPMLIKGDVPVEFHDADLVARANALACLPRHVSMALQGAPVAVDEMEHYLRMVADFAKCRFFTPCVVQTVVDANVQVNGWHMQGKQGISDVGVISAIVIDQHWHPIVWDHTGTRSSAEGATVLTGLGVEVTADVSLRDSQFPCDCGFITVAWLIAQMVHKPLEQIRGSILGALRQPVDAELAAWFRYSAWRTQYQNQVVVHPLVLGGQSELETAVCAILKEHGVFLSRVAERAKMVISKLGQNAVTDAMKAQKPWLMLKQLASAQQPELRLIMQEMSSK